MLGFWAFYSEDKYIRISFLFVLIGILYALITCVSEFFLYISLNIFLWFLSTDFYATGIIVFILNLLICCMIWCLLDSFPFISCCFKMSLTIWSPVSVLSSNSDTDHFCCSYCWQKLLSPDYVSFFFMD